MQALLEGHAKHGNKWATILREHRDKFDGQRYLKDKDVKSLSSLWIYTFYWSGEKKTTLMMFYGFVKRTSYLSSFYECVKRCSDDVSDPCGV